MPWTPDAPQLHFEVLGDGPPIVLLHEMGGSIFSWSLVADQLSTRLQVISVDLRGAGLSERAAAPYSFDDLAQDLLRVIRTLSPGRPPIVAGMAASAAVALRAAELSPDEIRALVLCGPALSLDAAGRQQALERADLVAAKGMRVMADPALARMYPEDFRRADFEAYRGRFIAHDPHAFAALNRAFAGMTVAPEQVGLPTLVLAGTQDVRTVAVVENATRFMPNCRLEAIPAGHVMAHQQPQLVAEQILAFAETLSDSC